MKIISICTIVLILICSMFLHYDYGKKLEIMESEFDLIKNEVRMQKSKVGNNNFMSEEEDNVDTFHADDNFKEFEKIIVEYVNNNIDDIVSEKPEIGAGWIVSSVEFLSPDIIKVIYEDGHDMGVMFFKIETAFDSKIIIKPFY